MSNVYLNHYEKNKISPVRQDLSNIEKHFYIRKRLYQQLGVPPLLLKGKHIAEIGAGSGYNVIVTADSEPKKYTIIEPNPTAIKHMKTLFQQYQVSENIIDIHNKMIEDFEGSEIFDIIIAEGFLPAIENKFEVLDKINSLLKPGGVIIITSADDISLFFEIARRFLANMLLRNESETDFDSKIDILVDAFENHLDTLEGFSRLKEDWCADVLMGDAIYQHELSPSDAINYLKEDFYYYNISPDIIKDESWFKEVPLDIVNYNKNKNKKFEQVWHNLFHYQVFKESRETTLNEELSSLCREFTILVKKSEYSVYNNELKENLLKNISKIENNLQGISKNISYSLKELYNIIEEDKFTANHIKNLNYFKKAFGRGQQYMSFIKKESH